MGMATFFADTYAIVELLKRLSVIMD